MGICLRSTHREKGVVSAYETTDVLGWAGTGCHRRSNPWLYDDDKRANDPFRAGQDCNGTESKESLEEGTR